MMVSLLLLAMGAPPAVCPVPGSIGHCVYFTLQRGDLNYTINVREDGKVHYWVGELPADKPESTLPWLSASAATVHKIVDALPVVPTDCETHQKNIANTGRKTISVFAGDEASVCTFNYSDDQQINTAAATFQAIAETMQTGERLKHKRRFDRLGLDAELDALAGEVKSGFAIELQNIAPILQSIADDDEVMSASRRKATILLTMAAAQLAVSAR